MKFALVCACSCLLFSTLLLPAHAFSEREKHPDFKSALKSLQKSRTDLMKGERDYGGHRTKAVQAIDAAVDEIRQAIAFEKHKD